MIKIYKIIKPDDPMTVYIGKTTMTLKERMRKHKNASKKKPNRKVYQWFCSTCEIELIENYTGLEELASKREMDIAYEYIANGYSVMNKQLGITETDPNYWQKLSSNRSTEYVNWQSRICKAAKKEGLTSKEYRIKHNIPDYSGPKTK